MFNQNSMQNFYLKDNKIRCKYFFIKYKIEM